MSLPSHLMVLSSDHQMPHKKVAALSTTVEMNIVPTDRIECDYVVDQRIFLG